MSDGQTLMVQGTTSDAGKSLLVTALCRIWQRRGLSVTPFKPQNMALNSAVTADGGEIGRAQALQAQAAGLAPQIDMNPVLLKPNSDCGCQVIVHGRPVADDLQAWDYHRYKSIAMAAVLASHRRLAERFDYLLVEGAGSPAEINLRDRDIANMGYAEAVDAPVILIADIDRGGVFAHLVGTLQLLSASERERVKGFVINKFRGEYSLLEPGIEWLEAHTGKPVLGVLPYLPGLHLDAEDAIATNTAGCGIDQPLRVAVPVLPRISKHTDFDPLRLHPQVALQWIYPGQLPGAVDLIILPGSKSVRADLRWLRAQGWEPVIQRHLRYGGRLLGICGGYQMLGERVDDPLGIEGTAGCEKGLGLLSVTTRLEPEKQLLQRRGVLALEETPVSGYEIHMGCTQGSALQRPLVRYEDGSDGALSADGQIAGCYLHGLFEEAGACDALLRWAGLAAPRSPDHAQRREAAIDRVADAVEAHLSLDRLLALCAAT